MRPAPIVPTTLPSRSNALRATSDTCQSPRSIIYRWLGEQGEGKWKQGGAYLVCGNEVADEQEDAHDNVLGDRDDV